MPERREEDVAMPGESSTSICKLASFYRRYKIEFHISGMVFCLIGGKVRGFSLFFRGIMGTQYCLNMMNSPVACVRTMYKCRGGGCPPVFFFSRTKS